MLDPRRPTSAPSSELQGSLLTDVLLMVGAIAAVYFAAYLYELGFLWRLGLPITLAEIGFSRSLTIVAIAAPAGCLLAGTFLRLRVLAGTAPGVPNPHAAITLGALGTAAATLLLPDVRGHFVDSALIAYGQAEVDFAKGAIFLGGIVTLALYFGHSARLLAGAEPGRVALGGVLLLLALAVVVGLGRRGAEAKEGRPGSFLYLAGTDFALVRLYPDKAVFLRFDHARGKFGSDYRVRHLDGSVTDSEIARDLEMR